MTDVHANKQPLPPLPEQVRLVTSLPRNNVDGQMAFIHSTSEMNRQFHENMSRGAAIVAGAVKGVEHVGFEAGIMAHATPGMSRGGDGHTI